MISLGIEGTAHTFGIGIFENEKCLANEKKMFKPEKGWGMHPTEVKAHHLKIKDSVLQASLEKAKISLNDVDIFSYSKGPGLPPCLKVTCEFAKTIAKKKPLIEVNHCIAHVEIGKLFTKSIDPLMLYVSGGNTQVIGFSSNRYRVFGETQDIPIGNAIDVFIREAGLDFPGGPVMEKLALNGKYIELPYTIKGMDLSFSGILTSAKQKIGKEKLEDLCFSFQETCFAMLIEVVERALSHTGKNELLLTGGVAANKRLQEMCNIMCKERNSKFYTVPFEYSGDNGAMIAWNGLLAYKSGQLPTKNPDFKQKWRTNEVEVYWV